MKLVAIAFGADGLAGDSQFYGEPEIPATDKSTYEGLLAKWRLWADDYFDDLGEDSYMDENDYDDPAGFWLLKPKDLEIAKTAYEIEAHNDSTCYHNNHMFKMLATKLASKTIKDK